MMHSAERLEIVFTSQPTTVTSTIFVYGEQIAHKTFRDQLRLSLWASTLEDIARATRNSPEANLNPHQGDTAQITAASRPEHRALEHRSGESGPTTASSASSVSSYGAETTSPVADQSHDILLAATSTHQSGLTRPSAETKSVESTSMKKDRLLSTRLMQPSKEVDTGDANTSVYKERAFFDTSSTSLSSNLSRSDLEASSSLFGSVSSRTSVGIGEQTPGVKRRQKLDVLLQCIRDQKNPKQADHDGKVDSLCNSTISFSTTTTTTVEQFGHLLGDLAHVSDVLGFMYGLLSWEVFRREEARLIQEEGQSARWAAKRMNDEMSKQSDRHATAKDWASDGRRAAGMVFGSLSELSVASKSLAIFLLADLAILDNLIKIAHFPVLRERFAVVFGEIHAARECKNEMAEGSGYKVFDFEAFLSTHGRSIKLGSLDPIAQQPRFDEEGIPTSLIHPQEVSSSENGYANLDTNDESRPKRQRLSSLSTAGDAKVMWSTYLHPTNNGSDQRRYTTPSAPNVLPITADKNKRGDQSFVRSPDEARLGSSVGSPQTEDYNMLFGPSPDFDASFQGPKSS